MRWRVVGCLISFGIVLVGLVCAVLGLYLLGSYETIFGETVRSQMFIDPSVLWWYKVWLAPPIQESTVVHLFEVENAQAMLAQPVTTKARLREVGPFVFRVQRFKQNIVSDPKDKRQIQYDERTMYHFDPLLSYEDLNQKITVVNSELMLLNPFIASVVRRASTVARLSRSLSENIEQILSLYQANIFVQKSIQDVIFGSKLDPDLNTESSPTTREPSIEMMATEEMVDLSEMFNNTMARQVEDRAGSDAKFRTITDRATIQILRLFDQAKLYYMDRLKVAMNPYSLMPKLDNNLHNVHLLNSISAFFKNNSVQTFNVLTGIESNRNAQIIGWNKQNLLRVWSGRACNMINGTDGRQYSPFLKDQTLYVFYPKLCRSIAYEFESEKMIEVSEIVYHRFELSASFMQSAHKNSGNACFCRWWNNTKRCNYDGVLDLATCYSGAPVMLSNAHFSGKMTRSIAREMTGLNPRSLYTQSYIDVEPISGIVLNRVQKFQFNVHIRQTPLEVKSNKTLREMVFPLFWYEETQKTTSEYEKSIKYFFIYPTKYKQLAVFAFIGLGVIMFGFGALLMLVSCLYKKKANDSSATSGKVSPNTTATRRSAAIEQVMRTEQDNYIHNQNYEDELDDHRFDYDYEQNADAEGSYGQANVQAQHQQQLQQPLKRDMPPMPGNRFRDLASNNEPETNVFYRQQPPIRNLVSNNANRHSQDVYGLAKNGNPEEWNDQEYYDSGNGSAGMANVEQQRMYQSGQAKSRGPPRLPLPLPPPPTMSDEIYSPSETGSRHNLMREIREGAKLRKTSISSYQRNAEQMWMLQNHRHLVINIANNNQQGAGRGMQDDPEVQPQDNSQLDNIFWARMFASSQKLSSPAVYRYEQELLALYHFQCQQQQQQQMLFNQASLLYLAEELARLSKQSAFASIQSNDGFHFRQAEQWKLTQSEIIDHDDDEEESNNKNLALRLADALKRRNESQSIANEESNQIRFYGPYRAYNDWGKARTSRTAYSWNTSFDDDDDEEGN